MAKHQALEHEEQEPEFIFKLVSYHRSSLNRQVREAVRIRRWGEGVVLNSKSEFNRCKLGRLTLEEEEKSIISTAKKMENTKESGEEGRPECPTTV